MVQLIIIGVCLTEGILTIIFNASLLLVFYKNPLKNMWQCSSILIFSVTLSDFVAGVAFVFWNASYWHGYWRQNWLGQASFALIWIVTLTSTLTLLVLSIERYLVVKWPWDAPQMITKRRTVLTCAIVWIVSIISCSLPVQKDQMYTRILVLSSIIEGSALIQAILYLLLWRQIKQTESLPGANFEAEQRQLNSVVFLLVIMTIVTMFPILISYQIQAVLVLTEKSPETRDRLSLALYYLLPLYTVNFCLNPLIYAWRLEKYRSSFVALVFRKTDQETLTNAEVNILSPGLAKKRKTRSEAASAGIQLI